MLHAINAKKASIESIVPDTAKRVPREDLVTSALFGTIQFLPASDRSRAISTLVNPGVVFKKPKVYLWPIFLYKGKRRSPDVVVVDTEGAPESRKIWIIEVKWEGQTQKSQISDQISDQIEVVSKGFLTLSDQEKKKIPGRLRGITLLGSRGRVKGPRSSVVIFSQVTWTSVSARLFDLENELQENSGLRNWAETTRAFLSQSVFGGVLSEWQKLRDVNRTQHFFGFLLPQSLHEVRPISYNFDAHQPDERKK